MTEHVGGRTPSHIKGLLTERASVAGELAQLQEHIAQLESRLSKLLLTQERLAKSLSFRQERLGRVDALLRALDVAIAMARTRTQTALTQLVETLAHLKGELAFVEAWLAGQVHPWN